MVLGGGTENDFIWTLRQKISGEGKVYGLGFFELKSRDEYRKYANAFAHRNYKHLSLLTGVEDGYYWSVTQYINRDGKLIGIGSSLINDKRERRRHTTLGTHGKIYTGLNKRKRPESCEVCDEPTNRLHYHHWDDSDMNKGIWCCARCHWIVEYYEMLSFNRICNLLSNYIKLKHKIEEDFEKI